MEVESEDEEEERERDRGGRVHGHAAQLDQDTRLQDMDEVRLSGWSSYQRDEEDLVMLALRTSLFT